MLWRREKSNTTTTVHPSKESLLTHSYTFTGVCMKPKFICKVFSLFSLLSLLSQYNSARTHVLKNIQNSRFYLHIIYICIDVCSPPYTVYFTEHSIYLPSHLQHQCSFPVPVINLNYLHSLTITSVQRCFTAKASKYNLMWPRNMFFKRTKQRFMQKLNNSLHFNVIQLPH